MENKEHILKKALDSVLKRQFPAIANIRIDPKRKNKYNIMLGTAHLGSDFVYHIILDMSGSDWKEHLDGYEIDSESYDQMQNEWSSIMKTVNLIVKLISLGKNDYTVIFNSVLDDN
jgi:hypothetical protein